MELTAGLQVFHNGRPVQLLYLITKMWDNEIWKVRPLFVTEPDRDEVFEQGDRLTLLHTRKATA